MHKGSPDTGVSQGQWVPVPLLQWCILCTPRSVAVGAPVWCSTKAIIMLAQTAMLAVSSMAPASMW